MLLLIETPLLLKDPPQFGGVIPVYVARRRRTANTIPAQLAFTRDLTLKVEAFATGTTSRHHNSKGLDKKEVFAATVGGRKFRFLGFLYYVGRYTVRSWKGKEAKEILYRKRIMKEGNRVTTLPGCHVEAPTVEPPRRRNRRSTEVLCRSVLARIEQQSSQNLSTRVLCRSVLA